MIKYTTIESKESIDDITTEYLEFLKEVDPDNYEELRTIEKLLSQHDQFIKQKPTGDA